MRWFLALSVLLAAQNALNAAVIEVTPKATAVLNMDFSPLDPQPSLDGPIVELPARAEPYLIQVDVSMRIYDLQPGQVGFSNTAFNVEVSGNSDFFTAPELGIPAWIPENPIVDYSPPWPTPTYSMWAINSDDGPNKNDLQAIILAGATAGFFGPTDLRHALGQDGDGQGAGTFHIKLSGHIDAAANAQILTPFGASTYNEDGLSTTTGNSAVGGSTVTFVVVPEPNCAMLLCVALPLLAMKLRR